MSVCVSVWHPVSRFHERVLGLELDGPLDDPGRAIDTSELLVLLGGRPHRNAGASDLAVSRLRVEARVLLCVQFSLYVWVVVSWKRDCVHAVSLAGSQGTG